MTHDQLSYGPEVKCHRYEPTNISLTRSVVLLFTSVCFVCHFCSVGGGGGGVQEVLLQTGIYDPHVTSRVVFLPGPGHS